MKVLLEMRPAFDGHAGIPQATRLLFRGLQQLPGVEVEGLIQSSNRVLAPGLQAGARQLPEHQRVDRLSRVVVSLQATANISLRERVLAGLRLAWQPSIQLLGTLLGRRVSLGHFDPTHFKDFVWRAMFARTLRLEDFEGVTAARFRVARVPWSAAHAGALAARWLGRALYPRLDTRGYDVMVAETPYPGRVSAGTTLVVRYHDAIPLLMPHTISDRAHHQAIHYHALKRNVADGAWFACVSDATRRDLVSIFPEAAARAVTLHNMVSLHYHAEESQAERVPEIIRTRLSHSITNNRPDAAQLKSGAPVDYLLMVSTIEPRKNHLTLLAAWEQLQVEQLPALKLVLVGSLGWEHKAIVKRLRPWMARGDLYILEEVPAAELRLLYRHARATVCPSYGEGFDFSGVEAMRCGGVVAASDIPVHREVFGAAAEYFSPYSAGLMAGAVQRVIAPGADARRAELMAAGAEVSARYLPERILPQWKAFLGRLGPIHESDVAYRSPEASEARS